MIKKRSHMNFCIECKEAFELKENPDYCEPCRILLDIAPGEYKDETKEQIWDLPIFGWAWRRNNLEA